MKESAALTFTTILGFVPFITFIVFLLPDLPAFRNYIEKLLMTTLVPQSAAQMSVYISEILQRKASFNIVNLIMLVITSYSLFSIITQSFDRILFINDTRRRDPLQNLMKFFGTIILGFLIILILFSTASLPIVSSLIHLGILKRIISVVLPLILWFMITMLIYLLVPSSRVSARILARSAATTAVLWFIVKSFFDFYIVHLTNMKTIYGILASMLIFLFWIYVNWIIILSGVVLISIQEKKNGKAVSKKTRIDIQLTISDTHELMGTESKIVSSMDEHSLRELLIKILQKENQ